MEHHSAQLDDDTLARWWQVTGESELRQLLHWRWDPIDIAHKFPWAADEYDRYAPRVADSLKCGANAEQIAEILWLIETDQMATSNSAAVAATHCEVADAVLERYKNSQERWRQFGPRPRYRGYWLSEPKGHKDFPRGAARAGVSDGDHEPGQVLTRDAAGEFQNLRTARIVASWATA